MIFEKSNFSAILFGDLNYKDYVIDNCLDKLLDVDLKTYGQVTKKIVNDPYHSVNPNMSDAFEPELDDLL